MPKTGERVTMQVLNPYQPPVHDDAPERAAARASSAWARLAGVFLLGNALLTVLELVALPAHAVARSSAVTATVDLLIGGALVIAGPRWRAWALVRCAFGAVVLTLPALAGGDVFALVFNLGVAWSLMGLLLGRPAPLSVVAACAVFTLYVVGSLLLLQRLRASGQ
jgi:hypothetical protein